MYNEIYKLIKETASKRNLKDSTVDAYCVTIHHFMESIGKTTLDDLTIHDVDVFLSEKRLVGIAPQTYNHYLSAIRFLYKRLLKIYLDEDDFPRMKNDIHLPIVLSKDEIDVILNATTNLKHKTILATMYSAGLRVSEVTHLHYWTFRERVNLFMSEIPKAGMNVIHFLLIVHLIYLQNTGLSMESQWIFYFLVNILEAIFVPIV